MSQEKHLFSKLARASVRSEKLTRPRWSEAAARDEMLMWLDKNENSDPELHGLTERLLKTLPMSLAYTYPELGKLYHKLARWVGVDVNQVVLTAGSDGAIRSVFEAFIDPGDLVAHTAPTFAMYPVYTQMYGATALPLSYQAGAKGPELGVASILDCLRSKKPKLLCLPNPDSPTGTVFEPSELRAILDQALSSGVLVLIDEAYHPFYPISVVEWIDSYPNLMVARTFAKAWGIAGARVGYAVAGRDLADLIHKVRPMYEVGTIGAALAERMLDFPEAMQAAVDRLNAGKTYFLTEMERLGFSGLRSHGNFCHVAFGTAAEKVHQALKPVVLYRRDTPDGCLRGYSRFSAAPEEQFEPIVAAIQRAVS
ncbi:MAG: histidinol-phosphate aminotransferase family protein [Oligoflexia bacterium]|nr:histidinol-phosphate aminotransferase family protein [Oligoflexia bacterium]